MKDVELMEHRDASNERAQALRRRYEYRRRILRGDLCLDPSSARRLVGPDCAYHLYRRFRSTSTTSRRRMPGR